MEQVNHPKHYNQGKIEVIEFIEDKALSFHRGNAVKYIARAGKKVPEKSCEEECLNLEIQDLKKARWYIERDIELLTAKMLQAAPRRPNDMNPRADK